MNSLASCLLVLFLLGAAVTSTTATGVCIGEATQCGKMFGPIFCADINGSPMCDKFFDTCQSICERSGVSKSYQSDCSCSMESAGCDDYGCRNKITCNGTPDCSDHDNMQDCALTRGCTWVPESETEAPTDSFLFISAGESLSDGNSTNGNSTGLLDGDFGYRPTFSKSLRSGGLSDKQAIEILDETMEDESGSSSCREQTWLWLLIGAYTVFHFL